ncbi:MAG: hypothetical protein JJV99_09565 [Colwellia sp.]|nr:hypothetical protein [Colwellia sp.]
MAKGLDTKKKGLSGDKPASLQNSAPKALHVKDPIEPIKGDLEKMEDTTEKSKQRL